MSLEGGGGGRDRGPGTPIMEDCPLESLGDNKLACVDMLLLPLVFHPLPPNTGTCYYSTYILQM